MEHHVKILVVDDSTVYRNTIENLLSEQGYLVRTAPSSEEALARLHAEPVSLVLTDIMMPGKSGLTLLKTVKERWPDTEVVIVSANASSFTIMQALRLGAYDFIVKPIDEEKILFSSVERALEKQRLSHENQRLIKDLSENNNQLESALEMMKSVNRACGVIASTLDISDILTHLVEMAVEQLKAQKGYLLLLEKGGQEFSMKVSVGIDHSLAKNFRLKSSRGLSGHVAREGSPLHIGQNAPSQLTALILEEDSTGDLFSTPGILSAPLVINGKVVGVVNVSGREDGRHFGPAETEFLTTLANHAAIALTNAGNYYRLKKTVK